MTHRIISWVCLGLAFGAAPICAQANTLPDTVLQAARKGDLPTVQSWVEQNSTEINSYGWDTRTLLHLSAAEGHLKVVEFLLAQGADPNLPGDCFYSLGLRQTPLHAAAWLGRAEAVDRLIRANARVNARDSHLKTPLHYGIYSANENVVRLLTTSGADIHAADRNGGTPYTGALEERRESLVNILLANASPNNVNAHGDTPLHLAASRGSIEQVRLLLSNDAPVNATNHLQLTPLHVAIEGGHWDATRELIRQGAALDIFAAAGLGPSADVRAMLQENPGLINATNRQGKTALHWAASAGRIAVTEYLLEQKARVRVRDSQGATALDLAAKAGHANIAERLLSAGAEPSVLFAALSGNRSLVARLLEAGAPVSDTTADGDTPLHLAVETDAPDVVLLLLNSGADPNAKNAAGKTPMDVAIERESEVLPLLLDAKPNLLSAPQGTETPLHIAIRNHNLGALPQLAEAGADLEARDEHGETPLLLALNNNNIEAMGILLRLGANIEGADPEGNTPLHKAVLTCFAWEEDDDFPIPADAPLWVRWGNKTGLFLLHQNASVHTTNHLGQTPFHMVGLRFDSGTRPSPHVEALVRALLQHKAAINARDANGMTPLHLAVCTQGFPLVHALLANGADVNGRDNSGRTALHYALGAGSEKDKSSTEVILHTGDASRPHTLSRIEFLSHDINLIGLLLKAKADPSIADAEGKTPLQIATELANPKIIDLFRNAGE